MKLDIINGWFFVVILVYLLLLLSGHFLEVINNEKRKCLYVNVNAFKEQMAEKKIIRPT